MLSTITTPWFSLRRFDGEEGGSEGGTDDGQEGADGAKPPKGDQKVADDAKPLTQADVDRIVKDRIARERAKFADYDAVKAKAAEFDKLDEANKTELEREKEARAAAETKATQASTTVERIAIRGAVIAAAAKLGALEPADVVALLPKDAVTVTVGDDGEVDVSGAEDAVKAILKDRPHWIASTRQQGTFDQGATGNGNGKADFRTATKEDLAAAQAKYGLRPRS